MKNFLIRLILEREKEIMLAIIAQMYSKIQQSCGSCVRENEERKLEKMRLDSHKNNEFTGSKNVDGT